MMPIVPFEYAKKKKVTGNWYHINVIEKQVFYCAIVLLWHVQMEII